jgi:hypothetical protein
MKKIIYFLLFLATVAHAGLFDKDIRVRIYPYCGTNNTVRKDVVINWNFTVEKNSVIQKQEVYDDKVLLQSDLKRLENCLVVDKANWKCGGESRVMPKGGVFKDSSKQVINGKFSFIELSIDGAITTPPCKIEQLN